MLYHTFLSILAVNIRQEHDQNTHRFNIERETGRLDKEHI